MSGQVPDDLRRWFAGKPILGSRYNLPRIEARWRVVEVLAVLDAPGQPWVVKGQWREFKTHDAAVRYQNKLASSAARPVLIQSGFTFWPDPDEWPGREKPSSGGGPRPIDPTNRKEDDA